MSNKYVSDLVGTLKSFFQIGGPSGPRLKNASGTIEVRNAADAAYAAIKASLVQATGEDIELNADAAGAGADWKYTFRRPSTGMTHALVVVFPSDDPAPGQALTVVSLVGDVVTLEWTTIAGGTDKVVSDTTTLAFGASSPLAMFTLPANAVVLMVRVIIDVAFNGAPTLSIGVSGTTSKYMGATDVVLTEATGTVFEVTPSSIANGSTENLIATYAAGAASVGSARIIVDYVIPS